MDNTDTDAPPIMGPSPATSTVSHYNGSSLTIFRAKRTNMGPYLCIASNGIPPSVSKRVMLIVQCKWRKMTSIN